MSKGAGCMVCTDRHWVGIWEDEDGHRFRACGSTNCTKGRTFIKGGPMISTEEKDELIKVAAAAGIGEGTLGSVIANTFNWPTIGQKYEPLERITSTQCKKLIDHFRTKAK